MIALFLKTASPPAAVALATSAVSKVAVSSILVTAVPSEFF